MEKKKTVADVPWHERVPWHLEEVLQRKFKHNRTMCDKNAYFIEFRIKRDDVEKKLMGDLT